MTERCKRDFFSSVLLLKNPPLDSNSSSVAFEAGADRRPCSVGVRLHYALQHGDDLSSDWGGHRLFFHLGPFTPVAECTETLKVIDPHGLFVPKSFDILM